MEFKGYVLRSRISSAGGLLLLFSRWGFGEGPSANEDLASPRQMRRDCVVS